MAKSGQVNLFVQPRKLTGSEYRPFAHHPHCERHGHHLIWIMNRPLCLGCVCMYGGIALSPLIQWFLPWMALSYWQWGIVFAGLLAPTAAQPWMQRKAFKVVSRSMLGVCIGLFGIGLIRIDYPVPGWAWRLSAALLAMVLWRGLLLLRQSRPNNPCSSCELGTYPTCDWNLPRLLRKTEDPVLRAAIGEHLGGEGQPALQIASTPSSPPPDDLLDE